MSDALTIEQARSRWLRERARHTMLPFPSRAESEVFNTGFRAGLEAAAQFTDDKWMHGRENVVAGIRALSEHEILRSVKP